MAQGNFEQKLENLIKNAGNIKREIELDAQRKIIKDINDICRTSVDMYYDSYTPKIYDRTGSLYKAYKIKIKRNDLVIELGAELIPDTHHQGTKYIYDVMFKEGWHGGGLNYDVGVSTPYWRKPMPYFTEWGDRAVKSEAPFDIIERRFNLYASRQIPRIIRASSNKIFSKYL